jgi:hypothetical protein
MTVDRSRPSKRANLDGPTDDVAAGAAEPTLIVSGGTRSGPPPRASQNTTAMSTSTAFDTPSRTATEIPPSSESLPTVRGAASLAIRPSGCDLIATNARMAPTSVDSEFARLPAPATQCLLRSSPSVTGGGCLASALVRGAAQARRTTRARKTIRRPVLLTRLRAPLR